jgi:ribosomal protein S18 acetylase RimI-like enzyme
MTATIRRIDLHFPHEGDMTMFCVVDEKGEIVGTIHAEILGAVVEFNRLFVHPENRRKGFAKTLIDHVIQLAKANRCGAVTCSVNPKNIEAINFYTSLGFFSVGKVYDDYLFVVQL